MFAKASRDPNSTRIELKISHEELSVMVGTTQSRITIFMQRFHNLGLMETNANRFLVIKEVKFADYVAQIVESLGVSARCAIILFKTVQLLDKGCFPD